MTRGIEIRYHRKPSSALCAAQGIGAGFVPGVLNIKVYDEIMQARLDMLHVASRQLCC